MESLPLEIVQQILTEVPKRSLPSCRLVCRTFETIAFPLLFRNVLNWLDYETSHRAIVSLAHDAYNRPAVMWSPWATGPDEPVDDAWMGILWRMLLNTPPPGLSIIGKCAEEVVAQGERVQLTPTNFAELSGKAIMTENRLRTSQNRYLMHRSYSQGIHCDVGWDGEKSNKSRCDTKFGLGNLY